MDGPERDWIRKNLHLLALDTICTDTVLIKLQGEKLLGPDDVETLKSKQEKRGDQAHTLYTILMTRVGAYTTLINVLREENQTGVVKILENLPLLCHDIGTDAHPMLSPGRPSPSEHNPAKGNEEEFWNSYGDSNQTTETIEERRRRFSRRGSRTNSASEQSVSLENTEMILLKEFDQISWSKLNDKEQEFCMKKTVQFQRRHCTLKKLCEIYESLSPTNSREVLLNKLDPVTLTKLIQETTPKFSDGNVPVSHHKYIARTIISRRHVSRRILEITEDNNHRDVLLFTGTDLKLYELQSLVDKYGNGKCDHSSNQVNQKQITARNILLEHEEHFLKVCELTQEPVHLFCCIKSDKSSDIIKLEWAKSRGSIASVHLHIHKLQSEEPDNILVEDGTMLPLLIADSPGMGKSTLMVKCACHLMTSKLPKNTYAYIQYIVIGEFIKEFEKFTLDDDSTDDKESDNILNNAIGRKMIGDRIFDILSTTASESTFEQIFIRSMLSSLSGKVKCELLFDGLDELLPNQLQLAKTILQYFAKYRRNVRIWVTMKQSMLREFEEALGVLGYTLKPLQNDDPVCIMTECWYSATTDANQIGQLKIFADGILQLTTDRMSEDEKLMTGIPLLCRLLGAVYEDEAKKFCHRGDLALDPSNIEQFTLTETYTKFVEKKLENTNVPLSKEYERKKLYFGHMELAIQLLFPELSSDPHFSGIFVTDQDLVTIGALQTFGIVESSSLNTTPRFSHRTLAEYFVAAAVVELLKRLEESVNSCHDAMEKNTIRPLLLLLRRVFSTKPTLITLSHVMKHPCQQYSFTFKSHNICYFLNHLLHNPPNINLLSRVALVYTQMTSSKEITSLYLWKCLVAAVVENFYGIACRVTEAMKLLFSAFTGERETFTPIWISSDHSASYEPIFHYILFFAAKYGSRKLMECICQFFEAWTSEPVAAQTLEWEYGEFQVNEMSLMHIAVEAGNHKVVNYLLNYQGYQERVQQDVNKNLFHFCLHNSNLADELGIRNRIRIISRLASLNKASYLMPKNLYFSIMPLMLKPGSLDLIIRLLSIVKSELEGTTLPNFVYMNSHGENIFHLLPTTYYDHSMTKEKYHQALESLEQFFNHNISIKEFCLNESEFAVSDNKSDLSDNKSELSDNKSDLSDNKSDLSDNKSDFSETESVVLETEPALKVYMESFNSAGWTPIHIATSCFDLQDETLDFFLKYQININLEDHRGSTCIYKAIAGHRSPDFLKRLIKKGSNYRHRKQLGEHVLHVAAGYYNYDAVELFVNEYGESVNVTDDDGNTPLHICFRKRNRGIYHDANMEVEIHPNNQHKIITFLIENGANIAKPNNKGLTPLHLALHICKGLEHNAFRRLKKSRKRLFHPANLTLALKGFILNSWIGSRWHPALMAFANELLLHGADVNCRDENDATLLHLAAAAHSLGTEYLLERRLVDAAAVDKDGKTALMYMSCYDNPTCCKIYNCQKIRDCLLNKVYTDRCSIMSRATSPNPLSRVSL